MTAYHAVLVFVALFLYLFFFSVEPFKRICGLHPIVLNSPLCSGTTAQQWKLFYHLGGNGPWIPKLSGDGTWDTPLPQGCAVDQAHMLSRHAERYPTKAAGTRHLDLLQRLRDSEVTSGGSLKFLQTWTYFTNTSDPAFEDLTTTGPYAGTNQSFRTGQTLRERYKHLVRTNETTTVWTCSSPRDVETATWFTRGFFGSDFSEREAAYVKVIQESEDRGGDTLTPGRTCRLYREDTEHGRDRGYQKLAKFQKEFSGPIIERLRQEAQGVQLSPVDVFSMMEMCGFEILARGSSRWCRVFSHNEWEQFAYARDLLHFYRSGPGTRYAGVMGWLWLNATKSLLLDDAADGVYFSFVHDGDIIPMVTTLGIMNEEGKPQLPADQVKEDRRWRTSDVVPMSGRVIFERVSCNDTAGSGLAGKKYVRLLVNDGLIRLGDSISTSKDPGMELIDFQVFVDAKGEEFGDFGEVCGLSADAPSRISFLHQ